jgi:hypothetical protein
LNSGKNKSYKGNPNPPPLSSLKTGNAEHLFIDLTRPLFGRDSARRCPLVAVRKDRRSAASPPANSATANTR